jgi:hypothetical protein
VGEIGICQRGFENILGGEGTGGYGGAFCQRLGVHICHARDATLYPLQFLVASTHCNPWLFVQPAFRVAHDAMLPCKERACAARPRVV